MDIHAPNAKTVIKTTIQCNEKCGTVVSENLFHHAPVLPLIGWSSIWKTSLNFLATCDNRFPDCFGYDGII